MLNRAKTIRHRHDIAMLDRVLNLSYHTRLSVRIGKDPISHQQYILCFLCCKNFNCTKFMWRQITLFLFYMSIRYRCQLLLKLLAISLMHGDAEFIHHRSDGLLMLYWGLDKWESWCRYLQQNSYKSKEKQKSRQTKIFLFPAERILKQKDKVFHHLMTQQPWLNVRIHSTPTSKEIIF